MRDANRPPLERLPSRRSTILTFLVLGPFVGSLCVFVGMAIAVSVAGGTASGGLIIASAGLFLALGYVLGLAPAAVAGGAYTFAPPRFQRLWLAPIFGIGGVWLADVISDVVSGGALVTGATPVHLGAGAVAALVCAWIARAQGWVSREVD